MANPLPPLAPPSLPMLPGTSRKSIDGHWRHSQVRQSAPLLLQCDSQMARAWPLPAPNSQRWCQETPKTCPDSVLTPLTALRPPSAIQDPPKQPKTPRRQPRGPPGFPQIAPKRFSQAATVSQHDFPSRLHCELSFRRLLLLLLCFSL